ncbi:MAG: hypothetical protein KVP17_003600 [Porospora cf. gigantea B]|uniref:uncharacterized protein n=1 Tax=Porospora cf. gigantea A TaxID=2853593 RepID=UPI0035596C17|nr:MAG: hypothetical protein KVP18_000631 [Porospora cf. gigantea A]KAH0488281.1 MAG: hypothetical protein KVP17_003600 [Porospora cf. gigantea B]
MSHLQSNPGRLYFDRKNFTREDWLDKIATSRCVYIGNLSFYATEDQIMQKFLEYGEIEKIVVGKSKERKSPCGFCFIVFEARTGAQRCIRFATGSVFDDRVIRVDWDSGDQIDDERQFGRGIHGQIRDDARRYYDAGRGGAGGNVQFSRMKRGRDEIS